MDDNEHEADAAYDDVWESYGTLRAGVYDGDGEEGPEESEGEPGAEVEAEPEAEGEDEGRRNRSEVLGFNHH
jgi:hypothetical protein